MVYIIIGAALLFIIVPIFAVLPSARQKQQMQMRKVAREAGVSVELTTIDDPNPKQDKYISNIGKVLPARLKVVCYRGKRHRAGDWRRLPQVHWCLQKKLVDGWQWREEPPDAMSDELRNWLGPAVRELPDDVEQVEESGYNIMVYWHERAENSETAVLNFLKTCSEIPLHEPDPDEPSD